MAALRRDMNAEVRLFFTALIFYTRIPCPAGLAFTHDRLNDATKYFPLVGWLVGSITASAFYVSALVLPQSVAVLLCLAAGVLITGAFHEDGFADVCDGFGGGWAKERILAIMKDSHTGAYGAIGIAMLLLLKFTTLAALTQPLVAPALITAHALSRFAATTLIFTLPYVREDSISKARQVAKSFTTAQFAIACLFGMLPLLVLFPPRFLWVLLPATFITVYLASYFKKRIGGYTGDCLGAIQQVVETVFYLAVLAISLGYP